MFRNHTSPTHFDELKPVFKLGLLQLVRTVLEQVVKNDTPVSVNRNSAPTTFRGGRMLYLIIKHVLETPVSELNALNFDLFL